MKIVPVFSWPQRWLWDCHKFSQGSYQKDRLSSHCCYFSCVKITIRSKRATSFIASIVFSCVSSLSVLLLHQFGDGFILFSNCHLHVWVFKGQNKTKKVLFACTWFSLNRKRILFYVIYQQQVGIIAFFRQTK